MNELQEKILLYSSIISYKILPLLHNIKLYSMNKLLFSLMGFFVFLTSQAIPAKSGKVVITQPDGTKIEVYIRGDERFHYYETMDGKILLPDSNGILRETDENLAELRAKAAKIRAKVQQPGEIKSKFPTTGTVRGLIVLAQYQDVKFSKEGTLEKFQSMAMSDNYKGENAPGSMREYFVTQSSGQFTPEFDVVGPVTLPQNRVYYGGSDSGQERIPEMMKDAATLAHEQFGVDFTKYDANNDGYVDFFYVIFAGYGQAQGGPTESVWPCAVDLTYDVSIPGFDGMYLGKTACSCELKGGTGTEIDGIGTFCHEFSHILGLPDIYDTEYTNRYGMGHYDIMDRGGYNNDGRTPAGYTAMDKYTVGWLKPTVLEETAQELKLEDLTESNKAYFIVSAKDKNEYYTLENRQPTKWDAALPGHGLVISHISYSAMNWSKNLINTSKAGFEHVQIVAADNLWDDISEENPNAEANDVFPGKDNLHKAFTSYTMPALTWRTGESSNGQGITNISITDGVVTFDYNAATTGIEDIVYPTADDTNKTYYTLQGERVNAAKLSKGIYIHAGKKIVIK